jgi:aryl-alcohol dehydrogenase-like predicted oxidoreductase
MSIQIQKRKLGATDIEISPIGLGVMQFSGSNGIFKFALPDIPQSEKNEIVHAALASGINWFDTAEIYGFGTSEESLSKALKANKVSNKDVLIATKWLPLLRTARNITRTINKRLDYLSGYSIDLYQIHHPWSFSSPKQEMDAMANLLQAGKIRSIGVSNFDAERMRKAHLALENRGVLLASNQVKYNLLDRSIEKNGILESAKEMSITIICWGPLASGLLSGKFHKDSSLIENIDIRRRKTFKERLEETRPIINALEDIALKYQATPAQVALNWLIHFNGETVVAIPGASKAYQAQESAAAMRFRLDDADLHKIDEITQHYRDSS